MRLLFCARAIDRMAGGVERMIISLMNDMVARGHEVNLLTWDRSGSEAFYPMAPEITWHRLDIGDPSIKAGKAQMLHRARAVRALVRHHRPQAVVCFQDGTFLAVRAYTLGYRIPIIVAERNAPTRFDHISAGRNRNLIYQCFRSAHLITIQCESFREHYPSFLWPKISCIPNPVFPADSYAKPGTPEPGGHYQLLSVGRLSYQKNYGILIEAFGELASSLPDWNLVIYGDGENRARLEELVASRGLEGRVKLPGVTTSITACYKTSQLFCLPSRWEGFPNALAESLAHGLPAVGFEGCAGVKDLIVHEQTGLLAEGNGDPKTLAAGLSILMKNPEPFWSAHHRLPYHREDDIFPKFHL